MTYVLFVDPNGKPLYVAAENVQAIGSGELIGTCMIFCQGGVSAMVHMTAHAVAQKLAEATDGSIVKLSVLAGDVN